MNDPVLSDDLLLSLLWVIPLAGSLITLALPKRAEAAIKGFALGVTIVTMQLRRRDRVRPIYRRRDEGGTAASQKRSARKRAAKNSTPEQVEAALTPPGESGVPRRISADTAAKMADSAPGDLVIRRPWIPSFNIQYYLGLDGISLSLILLTGLVSVLSCLASFSIEKQVKGYFSLFLLLTASMMGVFHRRHRHVPVLRLLRSFMLLPMYFLIAIWGGDNQGVCGDQVPPLHALRLGVHPRRDPDPLLLAGRRRRDGLGREVHGAFVRLGEARRGGRDLGLLRPVGPELGVLAVP